VHVQNGLVKKSKSERMIERLQKSLATTSLDDLVRAESERSLILVDVSSSMDETIKSGERKIDALRNVVRSLRESHPVPVAAFGGGVGQDAFQDRAAIVDEIPEPAGGTPMAEGIAFAKQITATHIVMVTDGVPNSMSAALDAARAFGGRIDVFYIGDGDDDGAHFCNTLAASTGGVSSVTGLDKPKELASKIAGLLPAASL
jgi:Mg-chelatase subunit ChlD